MDNSWFVFSVCIAIGLDVHDVGGYLDHCPPRPTDPGLKPLRFARDLKAGMYVTIEPGCYFIPHVSDVRCTFAHLAVDNERIIKKNLVFVLSTFAAFERSVEVSGEEQVFGERTIETLREVWRCSH